MSPSRRAVAIQRAPLPYDLVFDGPQKVHFDSPEAQELMFKKHHGVDIGPGYLESVHALFKEIVVNCYFPPEAPEGAERYIKRYSEVLYLNLVIYNKRSISLYWIVVRPCFEGHGMLALVMYQLALAACAAGIPQVGIYSCCPKTEDALVHTFGLDVECMLGHEGLPDYIIRDPGHLRMPKGLVGKIDDSDIQEGIWLKPEAYPTAEQLNSQKYVTDYFHQKYGARPPPITPRIRPQLPTFAADRDFDPSSAFLEAEFQRSMGEIKPDYIDSLNRMIATLVRDCFAFKDGVQELKKQTDTIFVHFIISKDEEDDDAAPCINLRRVSVRPCFEGNRMIIFWVYQTILLALALYDHAHIVVTCPMARWAAKRKLGACVFDDANALKNRVWAETLGIQDMIVNDEDNNALELVKAVFPSAEALNAARLNSSSSSVR